MDDLISIGTIGLIKGIDTFDETKNIRLATYAARCIDNELLMMLRAEKRAKDVSIYTIRSARIKKAMRSIFLTL